MRGRIAIFAVLLAILSLAPGCLGPQEGSLEHGLRYEVAVDAEEELRDVEVLAPVPVRDGEVLGLENASVPEGWEADLVETRRGEMLRIRADRIPAPTEFTPVPLEPGETPTGPTPNVTRRETEVRVEVTLNRSIDTRDPLTGEYTLRPKGEVEDAECEPVYPDATCFTFTAPVRLNYSPASASPGVLVTLDGYNTWFSGGWTGNEFNEVLSLPRGSTSPGWINATGRLRAGVGNYR